MKKRHDILMSCLFNYPTIPLNQINETWSDYAYWQGQDKKMLKIINILITDTKRSSFEG